MVTITGLYHVGLAANDPAALAAFYRDVLGMTVTGGSGPDGPHGATAFLSSRPEEEDHELAIFAEDRYRHLAFKVASLADLRAFSRQMAARGIPIKLTMRHGRSLAFYFDDPEGNMIEVYWPTDLDQGRADGEQINLEAWADEFIAQEASGMPDVRTSATREDTHIIAPEQQSQPGARRAERIGATGIRATSC